MVTDALASAERCQQAVHPLLEGYRAQIQHPYAALEVLEAELGPVGAERRNRAIAFRIVVVALERGRTGHCDATPSAEGADTHRFDQQTQLVTPVLWFDPGPLAEKDVPQDQRVSFLQVLRSKRAAATVS